jgi:hypothetical protein
MFGMPRDLTCNMDVDEKRRLQNTYQKIMEIILIKKVKYESHSPLWRSNEIEDYG